MPFKMHKIIFFQEKKYLKKICMPTLPKIFRHVTQNTLIHLFGLSITTPNYAKDKIPLLSLVSVAVKTKKTGFLYHVKGPLNYSKTCLKRPLKNRENKDLSDK